MALLDGKQPCQSPEQAALENTQRWLDEAASKAKAEHANTSLAGVARSSAPGTGGRVASSSAKGTGKCPPTSGSTSNALREEIAQLEAQNAKIFEEASEKTAATLAVTVKQKWLKSQLEE